MWSSFARVRNGSLAHFPVCQLSVLNFLNFLLINYGLLRIASLERHALFFGRFLATGACLVVFTVQVSLLSHLLLN